MADYKTKRHSVAGNDWEQKGRVIFCEHISELHAAAAR